MDTVKEAAGLRPDEFRCAQCGGIFTKGWSDEKSMEESCEMWGSFPDEEACLVCDVCFQKTMRAPTKGPKQ